MTNPTDSYPEGVIFHLEFSSKIKKKETKKERKKNSSFLEARYSELKNKPVCAILLTTRCCFAKCALNICAHICTTAIPTTPIYNTFCIQLNIKLFGWQTPRRQKKTFYSTYKRPELSLSACLLCHVVAGFQTS